MLISPVFPMGAVLKSRVSFFAIRSSQEIRLNPCLSSFFAQCVFPAPDMPISATLIIYSRLQKLSLQQLRAGHKKTSPVGGCKPQNNNLPYAGLVVLVITICRFIFFFSLANSLYLVKLAFLKFQVWQFVLRDFQRGLVLLLSGDLKL